MTKVLAAAAIAVAIGLSVTAGALAAGRTPAQGCTTRTEVTSRHPPVLTHTGRCRGAGAVLTGGAGPASRPNGCTSPAGDAPARRIIDTGASFRDACNAHDRCYRDHTLTRDGCDRVFYADMLTSCATAAHGNAWHAGYCAAWARVYWQAVAGFYRTRTDPSFFPHQWPRPPSRRLTPDRHVTLTV
jgi:hypothetical protein